MRPTKEELKAKVDRLQKELDEIKGELKQHDVLNDIEWLQTHCRVGQPGLHQPSAYSYEYEISMRDEGYVQAKTHCQVCRAELSFKTHMMFAVR